MTARNLYDIGADLAGSSPLPDRVNQLIISANNVSRGNSASVEGTVHG